MTDTVIIVDKQRITLTASELQRVTVTVHLITSFLMFNHCKVPLT
jgi:hypothetical protein